MPNENLDQEEVTLENIGGGAALEKFAIEHARVMRNIADINAKDGTRKIVLTVTYRKPQNSSVLKMSVDCKSALQPPKEFEAEAITSTEAGRLVARQVKPQEQMTFDGNVTDLQTVREK